jgi:signal transduction histidine kinase
MTFLEVLQFVGFSAGAILHLWMGWLLLRARRKLNRSERVLLVLTCGFGLWHLANFITALHSVLGLSYARGAQVLKLADTLAVIGITLSYSFLLHVHLHLWANAEGRALKLNEKIRVYTSYIPALFLWPAVRRIWAGPYQPHFDKLQGLQFAPAQWFGVELNFVAAFALWAGYALGFVAVTEFFIAQRAKTVGEKKSIQAIALAFLLLGGLIVAVFALGWGQGTALRPYLTTLVNLGSLLPSALIAYYIYRYRYLDLMIQESLIIAVFAAIVLAVYLYGIRAAGEWFAVNFGVRAGVIESLLILALALAAAPLRRWLEQRVRRLFEREATLYRELVTRIGAHAGPYGKLSQFLRFVETETAQALNLRRCAIAVSLPSVGADQTAESNRDALLDKLNFSATANGANSPLDAKLLQAQGFDAAYPLRNGAQQYGLMLVDAEPQALNHDARAVLEVLAGQVVVALENSRLFEENLHLERRVAHGERLASLGQMAATVAHEIKNPLSAIKSIAQAMQEDEALQDEYGRDLGLIVGETDRLSRSVTQLLSFARAAPHDSLPARVEELLRSTAELYRHAARPRNISIEWTCDSDAELDGPRAAALRDALTNLAGNAAQFAQNLVALSAREENNTLLITVTDDGPGVPLELRERIWQPFFTTRQRGTGLGLAIVRKRMEEAGGSAYLGDTAQGAAFLLRLPLA